MRGKVATFIASVAHKRIASIGRVLGILVYFIDARHRRIARRNLKLVYPEWPPERVKKVSKRVFQNLGITILEICQMICFSSDDILDKVKIRGEEHLLNAMHNNKGVIVISAHLGNWEIVPLFCPLYFNTPMTVVARQILNKMINRWIHGLRTRFGCRVIYKDVALPEMTRTLRQGKILAILIDQGTKSSLGVKIRFFNKFVTATPAAALLAMRCKSPVLPGFCTRNADGAFTIIIEPPLVLKRTGDLGADLKTNTQIMTDAIEKAVREYPEQWFWVHKRWRKYYPHLYPEDLARRRRSRAIKNREISRE
ncbi:MAG: lysophospholipid acyltransferase family protein [Thermodesulfobacteriota bacterium]|nr:lysophospholipid acyltransferase family protein [Thermodesulfobacteriota bacterium]